MCWASSVASLVRWMAEWLNLYGDDWRLCQALITCIMYPHFVTCLLEVHIALGFAAAAWKRDWLSRCVRVTLPLAFLLGAALVCAFNMSEKTLYMCGFTRSPMFGFAVFSCCTCALAAYASGIAKVMRLRGAVRRRAALRALTYLLSFLLTYGPFAVVDVYGWHLPWPKYSEPLMLGLVHLDGAFTVVIYWYWLRKAEASDERVTQGAVGTALEEPRSTISAIAQHAIDSHFDLFVGAPPEPSSVTDVASLLEPDLLCPDHRPASLAAQMRELTSMCSL